MTIASYISILAQSDTPIIGHVKITIKFVVQQILKGNRVKSIGKKDYNV